jgi:hypothetical protein
VIVVGALGGEVALLSSCKDLWALQWQLWADFGCTESGVVQGRWEAARGGVLGREQNFNKDGDDSLIASVCPFFRNSRSCPSCVLCLGSRAAVLSSYVDVTSANTRLALAMN